MMEGDVGPRWEPEEEAELLKPCREARVVGAICQGRLFQFQPQSQTWACSIRAAEEAQEEEEGQPTPHGGRLPSR